MGAFASYTARVFDQAHAARFSRLACNAGWPDGTKFWLSYPPVPATVDPARSTFCFAEGAETTYGSAVSAGGSEVIW